MSAQNIDLESAFQRLCQENIDDNDLKLFLDASHVDAAVNILVAKLIEYVTASEPDQDEFDTDIEWGVIHACSILGAIKDPRSAQVLVDVLDLVLVDYDSILHSTVMTAIEGMGQAVLEPLYEMYQLDIGIKERTSVWLWALSMIGVLDDRIKNALLRQMMIDPPDALNLIGNYADSRLLPVAEEYVDKLADYLNDNQIDPFADDARFEDHICDIYIDARESLALIKFEIPVDHPDYNARVEELDRRLLKYADFSCYEKALPVVENQKPGRNDPCPCGSGKKFKKCCGG